MTENNETEQTVDGQTEPVVHASTFMGDTTLAGFVKFSHALELIEPTTALILTVRDDVPTRLLTAMVRRIAYILDSDGMPSDGATWLEEIEYRLGKCDDEIPF